MRGRPCFKGLSLDGGQADFSKKASATIPIELAYFRPDPSCWTVPLKRGGNGRKLKNDREEIYEEGSIKISD
jgi:hypothetical protein